MELGNEPNNGPHETEMEFDEEEMEDRASTLLTTPQDSIDYLNQRLQKGNLNCHHFREWWRQKVPKVLCPSPSMDYQFPQSHIDEDEFTELLLDPLERFLCNGNPSVVFKQLSELDDPPAQCGKRFKMGEPTYSCRDCGQDQNCVLCVDCFKNSDHRFHRYKMGTSGGGGYCDCGDVQAWTKDTHCSIHTLGIQFSNNDPLSKLSPDIQVRARHVFTSVLKYVYDMLTTDTVLTLPSDLTFKDTSASVNDPLVNDFPGSNDLYATIIYNDEIHTFDEVITTLPRAVECDRVAAIGFATMIDREGRCLVKCSGFQVCSEVKRITERITSRRGSRPLKVVIMHSYVYAHQAFALRLLSWLQTVLNYSVGFKALFAKIMLDKEYRRMSLLESICRHDTVLWKQARNLMHHLLISGMLLNDDSKLQFARTFTKCYGNMMKDFILDDHDHSFSITSLAVQLFTVQSLAHYLIANDDVLAILLRTFMSECDRKRNENGKIEFLRNNNTTGFRRSNYILHDLKYLLTTPPSSNDDGWSNELRKGFLHGLSLLLDVLSWIQGMDSQKRQVDEHVEFELQWDSAFHLQIKLAPIFASIVAWAGTDYVVFIKSVRLILNRLKDLKDYEDDDVTTCRVMTDGKPPFKVIDYRVSSKPVSIHLPITRLLAGLTVHFEKFDLTYDSNEFSISGKPDPLCLVELPVRTMALIAQVQAGMWRRNGYSLVDQLRAYHSPHCCKEMLDQDVVMLQFGASLMDPDHFIVNLVHKFQLINWTNRKFDCAEDDSIRQVITLVEEFFGTLIIILGERYHPGIGRISAKDALKREIIQLLCVEPMTHSAINKSLPDGIDNREMIIESVADFKKPSSTTGKGYFELKPEFYSEYNVFFYHYTREDQSKSEEAQRARKRANNEPECCPPPRPPPFTDRFRKTAEILRADGFIYLLSLVLERADNLKSRCFSENQVHRVLHLIGLSLYEQQRYKERPDEDEKDYFTTRASKFNILPLMEQLVGSQRIENHKALLTWTIQFWKDVSGDRGLNSSNSNVVDKTMNVDNNDNNNNDNNEDDDDNDNDEGEERTLKQKRAEMAKARRLKIMAQMKSAQSKFMKENAELLQEATTSSSSTTNNNNTAANLPMEIDPPHSAICVGSNRSIPTTTETTFTCILCQEDERLWAQGPSLVMACFVQRSTVLSKVYNSTLNDDDDEDGLKSKFPLLSADLSMAPHTSSCGHIMHSTCWQKYYDDIVQHERHRSRMRHPQSFDVEKDEFLCPLCRCISNSVIPLLSPFHTLQRPNDVTNLSFNKWLEALSISLKYKRTLTNDDDDDDDDDDHDAETKKKEEGKDEDIKKTLKVIRYYYTCPLDQVVSDMNGISDTEFAELYKGSELDFSKSTFEMMNLFAQTTYRIGLDVLPDQSDQRVPLMIWQSCAYTIHSTISTVLDQGKPIFGATSSRLSDCLRTLIRFCGIVGRSNFGEPKVIRSHCLKLLSILFHDYDDGDGINPCILEFDAFGILVALTFSLPSLFNDDRSAPLPSSNVQDFYLLRITFLLHLVQLLLPTLKSVDEFDDVMASELKESGSKKWTELKLKSLPFLRCAALFYHHLSGVSAPVELQDAYRVSNPESEYEKLTKYLDLVDHADGFVDSIRDLNREYNLVSKWIRHSRIRRYLYENTRRCWKQHGLVDLPKDYSELINSVSSFTCPKSLCDDSRVPAMCLICGEILCSQSYCCQTTINGVLVGACTAHAQRCAAGNGIFLRVRECKVVLVSGRSKGCFIPPPYLDQYGETDMGLRRGNPLTLCPQRYKKICRLWLNHGIPEEISYNLESNQLLITTPWQHL